jgi:hypothetical protein
MIQSKYQPGKSYMMNIRFNDKKDKSLNNRINTVLLLPSTKLANKL